MLGKVIFTGAPGTISSAWRSIKNMAQINTLSLIHCFSDLLYTVLQAISSKQQGFRSSLH